MKRFIEICTLAAFGFFIGAVISLPFTIRELSYELRAIHQTLKQQSERAKE